MLTDTSLLSSLLPLPLLLLPCATCAFILPALFSSPSPFYLLLHHILDHAAARKGATLSDAVWKRLCTLMPHVDKAVAQLSGNTDDDDSDGDN